LPAVQLSGPEGHGEVGDAVKLFAGEAAGGLHGDPVHDADEEEGEGFRISAGGEVAFGKGAVEAGANLGDAAGAQGGDLGADGGVFGAGGERSVDPEAAAGVGGVGGVGDGTAEEGLGDEAGGGLAERAAHVAARAGAVAGHGLAEERGLVSEGGVEAGAVDAHGRGELGE